MEDDIVFLSQRPRSNSTGFGSQMQNSFLNSLPSSMRPVSGQRVSEQETALIANQDFKFDNRRRSVLRRISPILLAADALSNKNRGKKDVSRALSLTAVSQDDYTSLANMDLFRGGSLKDVLDTKVTTSQFQQNQSGNVARTKGKELSLLSQSDLEGLAKVVSARQGDITSRALSPGLQAQSFSLLGGNFGR